MSQFFLGLDLGQAQDYTAFAILERIDRHAKIVGDADTPEQAFRNVIAQVEEEKRQQALNLYNATTSFKATTPWQKLHRWTLKLGKEGLITKEQGRNPRPEYHLRHLERAELGTSYTDIVTRVINLMESAQLYRQTSLIVDATGVGAPVMDLLKRRGLSHAIPVVITGGDDVSFKKGTYRVPKRDLVASLSVLFQNGRLKIAKDLPEAQTLINELLNFRVRISTAGHDSYEAWREGAHDDLVLATALATWMAERGGVFCG